MLTSRQLSSIRKLTGMHSGNNELNHRMHASYIRTGRADRTVVVGRVTGRNLSSGLVCHILLSQKIAPGRFHLCEFVCRGSRE